VAEEENRFSDADSALDKCLALQDPSPTCYYESALTKVRKGQFDDAIQLINTARSQKVNYAWFDQPLGYAELGEYHLEAAESHFEALAYLGKNQSSPIHSQAAEDGEAAVYLFQGKVQRARDELEKSKNASSSPFERAEYFVLLAKIDAIFGDQAKAANELEQAMQESQAEELLIPIARTSAAIGEFRLAHQALGSVKKPSNLGFAYSSAEKLIEGLEHVKVAHNPDAGVADMQSALDFDNDGLAHYLLARIQMDEKKWKPASTTLQQLIEGRGVINIDGVSGLIPLAEYDLGVCYDRQRMEQDAKQQFSNAAKAWSDGDKELVVAMMPELH
jgi:tetratricopeptide (TPR) repeat protein